MAPKELVNHLCLALKRELRQRRLSVRCMSELLGLHGTTLGRILKGGRPVRLSLVLDLLAQLHQPPEEFFSELFPLGGEAIAQLSAAPQHGADNSRTRKFVQVLAAKGPQSRPTAELTKAAGRWLRDVLAESRVKQRYVSRQIGLGPDSLGQALRGNTELTFLHIFAALEAARVPPGRFFFDLFLPQPLSAADKARRDELTNLLEKGISRTAAALLQRCEAAGATTQKHPAGSQVTGKRQ